jgi:hypothetical protein
MKNEKTPRPSADKKYTLKNVPNGNIAAKTPDLACKVISG